MKKFFNKLNTILYNIFDANAFGVVSMAGFFMGGCFMAGGMFIPGCVFMAIGGASLAVSVTKNVIAYIKNQKSELQENIGTNLEEEMLENVDQAENTTVVEQYKAYKQSKDKTVNKTVSKSAPIKSEKDIDEKDI